MRKQRPIDWDLPPLGVYEGFYKSLLNRGHIKRKGLKNTIHLQCTHCDDTIHSSYSGEYVSCKCGVIGVDQTEFYTRIIGNEGDYLVVNKQKEVEK